jgi:hypothetical protein
VTVVPRLRIHIHFGMACITFSSMARGGYANSARLHDENVQAPIPCRFFVRGVTATVD